MQLKHRIVQFCVCLVSALLFCLIFTKAVTNIWEQNIITFFPLRPCSQLLSWRFYISYKLLMQVCRFMVITKTCVWMKKKVVNTHHQPFSLRKRRARRKNKCKIARNVELSLYIAALSLEREAAPKRRRNLPITSALLFHLPRLYDSLSICSLPPKVEKVFWRTTHWAKESISFARLDCKHHRLWIMHFVCKAKNTRTVRHLAKVSCSAEKRGESFVRGRACGRCSALFPPYLRPSHSRLTQTVLNTPNVLLSSSAFVTFLLRSFMSLDTSSATPSPVTSRSRRRRNTAARRCFAQSPRAIRRNACFSS